MNTIIRIPLTKAEINQQKLEMKAMSLNQFNVKVNYPRIKRFLNNESYIVYIFQN